MFKQIDFNKKQNINKIYKDMAPQISIEISNQFSYYKHNCKDILSHFESLQTLQQKMENQLLELQSSLLQKSQNLPYFSNDHLLHTLQQYLIQDIQTKLQNNFTMDKSTKQSIQDLYKKLKKSKTDWQNKGFSEKEKNECETNRNDVIQVLCDGFKKRRETLKLQRMSLELNVKDTQEIKKYQKVEKRRSSKVGYVIFGGELDVFGDNAVDKQVFSQNTFLDLPFSNTYFRFYIFEQYYFPTIQFFRLLQEEFDVRAFRRVIWLSMGDGMVERELLNNWQILGKDQKRLQSLKGNSLQEIVENYEQASQEVQQNTIEEIRWVVWMVAKNIKRENQQQMYDKLMFFVLMKNQSWNQIEFSHIPQNYEFKLARFVLKELEKVLLNDKIFLDQDSELTIDENFQFLQNYSKVHLQMHPTFFGMIIMEFLFQKNVFYTWIKRTQIQENLLNLTSNNQEIDIKEALNFQGISQPYIDAIIELINLSQNISDFELNLLKNQHYHLQIFNIRQKLKIYTENFDTYFQDFLYLNGQSNVDSILSGYYSDKNEQIFDLIEKIQTKIEKMSENLNQLQMNTLISQNDNYIQKYANPMLDSLYKLLDQTSSNELEKNILNLAQKLMFFDLFIKDKVSFHEHSFYDQVSDTLAQCFMHLEQKNEEIFKSFTKKEMWSINDANQSLVSLNHTLSVIDFIYFLSNTNEIFTPYLKEQNHFSSFLQKRLSLLLVQSFQNYFSFVTEQAKMQDDLKKIFLMLGNLVKIKSFVIDEWDNNYDQDMKKCILEDVTINGEKICIEAVKIINDQYLIPLFFDKLYKNFDKKMFENLEPHQFQNQYSESAQNLFVEVNQLLNYLTKKVCKEFRKILFANLHDKIQNQFIAQLDQRVEVRKLDKLANFLHLELYFLKQKVITHFDEQQFEIFDQISLIIQFLSKHKDFIKSFQPTEYNMATYQTALKLRSFKSLKKELAYKAMKYFE